MKEEESQLEIAILSDLHCHPDYSNDSEKTKRNNETYLLSDRLRNPIKDHPIENIVQIIKDENIKCDLTLCPGDFTNRCDRQGFISGWDFSLEVHHALEADEIISTLGNHDVDSFGIESTYSFENAKGIRKGFPFSGDEVLLKDFWSDGYVFIEKKNYRVLVINSSHYHYNSEESKRGKIDSNSLFAIEKYLKDKKDNKLAIAMSHHPPKTHDRKKLGEKDLIIGGRELLDILADNCFDLFVYGHKHDPWYRIHTSDEGNSLHLFSSGSFSSTANLMYTSERNFFHKIYLKRENKLSKGIIETWTYKPNTGWEIIYDSSSFQPRIGFGSDKSIHCIVSSIIETMEGHKKMFWKDLIEDISDLKYLSPKKIEDIMKEISEKEYISSKQNIFEEGSYLFNTNI